MLCCAVLCRAATGAINSLAAGLTRLANSATTNMVSNVNSMKSSLASFKALPGFQLSPSDFGLGGASLQSLTGPTVAAAAGGGSRGGGGVGELYTAGTGSVELTRRLQQQWQEHAEWEGPSCGLKQVHAMLQDDRQQSRGSLDAQRDQQEQQQQQRQDATAQAAAGSAFGQTGQLSTPCLAAPPAAAKQFAGADALSEPAQHHQNQQEQQQQHGGVAAAAASNRLPLWQKEHHSSIKPGGPKLVSGGPAAANIMIFPKHDDVSIITGIQEAWAGLRPHGGSTAAATADSSSDGRGYVGGSSTGDGGGGTAQQPAAAAATASQLASNQSIGRNSRSGGQSRVTPFAIEQPSATAAAAAAAGGRPSSAAAGAPRTNGVSDTTRSSSSSSMKRCTSEPSLQQWASDGLQALGEPSWVTLSRSSDGGSGRRGQQQQPQQGGGGQDGSGSSSGEGGGVGDSTVHALESDLKKTARLYPPGR